MASFFDTTHRPVWLVHLSTEKRGQVPAKVDIKYVRAATKAGAVRCARWHSMLPRRASAWAKVATPAELGCTPTGAQL